MSSLSGSSYIYDLLPEAARRLARTPRYARLIARLPESEFGKLVDQWSSYWNVYTYVSDSNSGDTGVIDSGLRASEACWLGFEKIPDLDPHRRSQHTRRKQMRLAMAMLGAIAFEMIFPTPDPPSQDDDLFVSSDENTSPQTGEVDETDDHLREMIEGPHQVDQFRDKVRRRMTLREKDPAVYYRDDPRQPIGADHFDIDWERLRAMNSDGLDHLTLSAFDERLRFKDMTVLAFFAAHWACNYATDDDRTVMLRRLPYPLPGHRDANGPYREFWEFVVQTQWDQGDKPNAVRISWTKLFSLIYQPNHRAAARDSQGLPIRCSELIYRTWDRMAGTKARADFLKEFQDLCKGQLGSKAQQATALGILWRNGSSSGPSQFIGLCEGKLEKDNGIFPSGGAVEQFAGIRMEPYRLHRYCVSNEEYELFDPRHKELRAFGAVEDIDRHPVVNVSWYDAWIYTQWLGGQTINGVEYELGLPTEAQWEYACRCGENTSFTWPDGQNGERIESGDCNFNGNHPWGSGARESKSPIYLGRMIPVDGKDGELQVLENPWGFSQMHGNVWEWCQDKWTTEAVVRVLRGGSWIYDGWNCRSACRGRSVPGDRHVLSGFRLAAVPVSGGGERSVGQRRRSKAEPRRAEL